MKHNTPKVMECSKNNAQRNIIGVNVFISKRKYQSEVKLTLYKNGKRREK